MTETANTPKRLIIKEAIEAGGATKESLMEAAECSAASLATNFTYLRLMGFYPVKAEDDTFSFVDESEWDDIQAERKAKATTRKTAKPKSPEETLALAEKRVARCQKALEVAETKNEQFGNEITGLRLTITTAELRLAELALEEALANIGPEDEAADDTTHIDTDDTDLV